MDFFWHDTMYVIPWYLVVVASGLVLGVLVAAILLFSGLLGRARHRQ